MSKTWKLAIGVLVILVVLFGLGLLHWGEIVYWRSGGERGWSLGAAVYRLLGWGVKAYRSDFGWRPFDGRHLTLGRGFIMWRAWLLRVAGGLMRLVFFAALVVLAFVAGRYWHKSPPAAGPTPSTQ
ncbi:MAG: hypothetical protein H5T64_03235 [Chloroflexi bacterium]|nr:hypothetical protein [Chloroflexota bacterium]